MLAWRVIANIMSELALQVSLMVHNSLAKRTDDFNVQNKHKLTTTTWDQLACSSLMEQIANQWFSQTIRTLHDVIS